MTKEVKIKVTEWQNENAMTEESMYDALFPLSKVYFVRLFPKKIEVVHRTEEKEHKESFCDLCGTPVEIYTSYEGTSCYVPKRPAVRLPERKTETTSSGQGDFNLGYNQALAEVEALNKEE